ncbi:flagellar hook-associated protein FlgK [Breoghania sp. L-A4]|uniref:flagellar hook-associated protein FlgK n=1 Tax=Breoghania sp. L-A4 TaxID=2304600 RepID=UPI000E35A807|nr:flagellar hook-associated protein FlgK [Breoghania sp. L-A4]AXS41225.1 flagellar hook-associated protein FlgK [Breoghania sp. L-A4]
MGLSSALNTALYGLAFNQRQLDVTAANIASADTVGYTKKSVTASVYYGNDGQVIGVVGDQVNRSLDEQVQAQYRTSQADMEFINLMASYSSRVDELVGSLNDPGSLTQVMSDFVGSLADLASSPEDFTIRLTTMQNAKALASELNSATATIQRMRQDAETGISDTVDRINELVKNVGAIDQEIVLQKAGGFSATDLLDQRDRYLDELSGLVDLNIKEAENGSVRLHTTNGILLLDVYASDLRFDKRATISAESQWDADPALRGVGTLTLVAAGGSTTDLISTNGIGSGELGAYLAMRDDYLVTAQNQLDEIASQLSLALSNYTVPGTAAGGPNPAPAGFDIDLYNQLEKGNVATLTYTDVGSGESRTVSFVRVDDPSQLPLANSATANPSDTVFGIDFTAGTADTASIVAQIQTALGGTFTVSDEGGDVIRILDDGGTATSVTGLSANVTATGLTGEGTALPLFTDGVTNQSYTNALDGRDQKIGYAGRITVNRALAEDSSRLVIYETSPETLSGDPTRPQALYDALTKTAFQFDSASGIGTKTAPFNGSVVDYLTEMIAHQGALSAGIETSRAGQEVVSNNLRDRLDASSEVNIDEELARLIELQNAYSANARVMTIVQEMFDVLMRV